jgi:hypothetical protein
MKKFAKGYLARYFRKVTTFVPIKRSLEYRRLKNYYVALKLRKKRKREKSFKTLLQFLPKNVIRQYPHQLVSGGIRHGGAKGKTINKTILPVNSRRFLRLKNFPLARFDKYSSLPYGGNYSFGLRFGDRLDQKLISNYMDTVRFFALPAWKKRNFENRFLSWNREYTQWGNLSHTRYDPWNSIILARFYVSNQLPYDRGTAFYRFFFRVSENFVQISEIPAFFNLIYFFTLMLNYIIMVPLFMPWPLFTLF